MDNKKLPTIAPVGQYPYNLVTVWPDGRELHIDCDGLLTIRSNSTML